MHGKTDYSLPFIEEPEKEAMRRIYEILEPFKNNGLLIHTSADPDLSHSIFLAGPTPRNSSTPSWRSEALSLIKDKGFDGHIFSPEPFNGSYEDQVAWETTHLEEAGIILFWIPRELTVLPGFTTNIEFGEYMKSGKCVVGFPKDTPKTRYIELKCELHKIPVHRTLKETIHSACEKLRIKKIENSYSPPTSFKGF